jgi:hypothetical protein
MRGENFTASQDVWIRADLDISMAVNNFRENVEYGMPDWKS